MEGRISDLLKSIPAGKEEVRQAFLLLQSHSSAFSSFNLQWSDVDSHISFLQTSLEFRFKHLQSKLLQQQQQQNQQNHEQNKQQRPSSPTQPKKPPKTPKPSSQSDLNSLCIKMNGPGLRNFITHHQKELSSDLPRITKALRLAPDPAKLVLHSLQGFYPRQTSFLYDKAELRDIRKICVLLLETLSEIGPEITQEVKEEARELAVEWKGRISADAYLQLLATSGLGDEVGVDELIDLWKGRISVDAYLLLLATFGLGDEVGVDELIDLLAQVARRGKPVELCKRLRFQSHVPDLIKKLNSMGKQVDAVQFAYAFDLVAMFPPVALLEAYLKESNKVVQEVLHKGNYSYESQKEAIGKEISDLKVMINCIKEYKVEYPCEKLEKRIDELKNQKPFKKRPGEVRVAMGRGGFCHSHPRSV